MILIAEVQDEIVVILLILFLEDLKDRIRSRDAIATT